MAVLPVWKHVLIIYAFSSPPRQHKGCPRPRSFAAGASCRGAPLNSHVQINVVTTRRYREAGRSNVPVRFVTLGRAMSQAFIVRWFAMRPIVRMRDA